MNSSSLNYPLPNYTIMMSLNIIKNILFSSLSHVTSVVFLFLNNTSTYRVRIHSITSLNFNLHSHFNHFISRPRIIYRIYCFFFYLPPSWPPQSRSGTITGLSLYTSKLWNNEHKFNTTESCPTVFRVYRQSEFCIMHELYVRYMPPAHTTYAGLNRRSRVQFYSKVTEIPYLPRWLYVLYIV